MEPPRNYLHVQHQDQHQDDVDARSSTEVDESLMGDEKHPEWHRPSRKSKRTKAASLFQSYRWIIDTSLLLVILALLVRDQWRQSSPAHPWDFGGDFTGVGPKFSQQITKFKSDQSFAPMNTSEFFTDEVLMKWNMLMPKGMGFVWVNETHKYHDLPTPVDWPDKTVFTTSMTHQLHCLFAIVQTYSGLKANHTIPDDHHWHMIHCFDYMREAIMCSADIALEGHETTFPDDNGGSDGWDSKHVCKDYGQVINYLESVRAYDDQLIY
ncbi:hypothetical protein B0T24DRAFT_636073 [Lasiosphaeria ovina]|uniref:Oxidase ustYa n=1 Tax=Lasiosphaeria ovina TaxID=92902 RepID=A0AAE0N0D8_9PEZI|nr:hypothetical protein B0T24DRAFT_636073 [Lasiosphaeria ovina]